MNTVTENTEFWLDTVSIRQIRKPDLPGLEWGGEYKHFRRIYADAYQRVLKGLSLIWVAELHPVGLIGQLFIQLNCDRPELADGVYKAYMYAFRIRETFRSRGLGTLMMKTIESDLKRRSFSVLTLNVAKDNPRAQELYKRLGFVVTSDEPGIWSYPDDKGIWHQVHEPAWRMEKTL
ncbi:MAG: GNAT family N-acetyltransferase [Anaerolineae bacterium]|nr:GNAT family N-acetyltransferase [Anaerolineae bacterium]